MLPLHAIGSADGRQHHTNYDQRDRRKGRLSETVREGGGIKTTTVRLK